MTTKTVKRHYCDFCRKAGFKKPTIERHEATCFYNPKRACWVCDEHGFDPVNLKSLIKAAGSGLEAVKSLTSCPACITSALAQHRKYNPDAEWVEYDYKEEMNEVHRNATPELASKLILP